jgi:hypothetical protein
MLLSVRFAEAWSGLWLHEQLAAARLSRGRPVTPAQLQLLPRWVQAAVSPMQHEATWRHLDARLTLAVRDPLALADEDGDGVLNRRELARLPGDWSAACAAWLRAQKNLTERLQGAMATYLSVPERLEPVLHQRSAGARRELVADFHAEARAFTLEDPRWSVVRHPDTALRVVGTWGRVLSVRFDVDPDLSIVMRATV